MSTIVSVPASTDCRAASRGVRHESTRWKYEFQGMPPSTSISDVSHQVKTAPPAAERRPAPVKKPAPAPVGKPVQRSKPKAEEDGNWVDF